MFADIVSQIFIIDVDYFIQFIKTINHETGKKLNDHLLLSHFIGKFVRLIKKSNYSKVDRPDVLKYKSDVMSLHLYMFIKHGRSTEQIKILLSI